MKTIRTLLAVSILATAGAANAAFGVAYTVSDSGTLYSPSWPLEGTVISEAPGSNPKARNFSNTATLNVVGSSGVLTIYSNITTPSNATSFPIIPHFANLVTINGSWNGTLFAPTEGSFVIYDCVGYCPTPKGTTVPYNSISGSLSLSGGSISVESIINTDNDVHQLETFSLTTLGIYYGTPEVPVPAAAWLFGSGLIGLAGVARRRTK